MRLVRGQFAANLAALIAGLPVWLLAWWPAQARHAPAGPAGVAARRSWLRRLYLYGFALAAVLVTLVSAIAIVYRMLNAVLRLGEGGNVLANMARSAGFAVIFTAVWLYHVWVLRQDGRHTAADRAVEAEQRAAAQATVTAAATARWAGVIVAVVDDGDGRFARLALGRPAPRPAHAHAAASRLTAAAVAALAAEQPATPPSAPAEPIAGNALGPDPTAGAEGRSRERPPLAITRTLFRQPHADKTVFAVPVADCLCPRRSAQPA